MDIDAGCTTIFENNYICKLPINTCNKILPDKECIACLLNIKFIEFHNNQNNKFCKILDKIN